MLRAGVAHAFLALWFFHAPCVMAEEELLFDSVRFENGGLPAQKLRQLEQLWRGQPERAPTDATVERRLALFRELPFVGALEWRIEALVDGGAELVVRVTSREVVRRVDLKGLGQVWRPVFEPDARKVLGLRVGDAFDEAKLESDLERLRALFQNRGFMEVRCEAKLTRQTGSVSIRHDCARGPSYHVGRIEVQGASAFPPEKVAQDLRPWPWPFYMKDAVQREVDDLLESYREHGYVAATLEILERNPRPETQEVDLVVRVVEGKRLEVEFEGNEVLSKRKLSKVLPFRPERSYGSFLVGDGADAIRRAYEKKGYPDTKVRSSRDFGEERVLVHYRIEEGARFELAGVRVEGSAAFDAAQIDEVIAAERKRWLVLDPVWDSEKLEADRNAIASLYRANGYADVSVTGPRRDANEQGLVAIFQVSEGRRYEIGEVSVAGMPEAHAEDAAAIERAAKAGAPYRPQDIDAWSQRLAGHLHDSGYLNGAVKAEARREGARVDVTLHVTPGPLFGTGPIFLLGNNYTRDSVVEAALAIETDDVLVPDEMAKTQKQLRALDVFESIRLTPVGLNAASRFASEGEYRAPVVLQFRERVRVELGAGARFDTDRGFGGTAFVNHNNLLGRALQADLEGEVGERDRAVGLALTNPRLFGYSIRGTGFGSFSDREFEAFDEREYLAGGQLARLLSDHWRVAFDLAYRLTDTSNVADPTDPDATEEGTARALLWTPSLSYDSRDSPLRPTRGMLSSYSVTVSTTAIASDDDFVRFDVRQRKYWKLVDGVIAVFGASFAHVELFGSTVDVPAAELLFAGGGTTVRGFEEDRVGVLSSDDSPLGGSTRVIGNFELRFPVYLPLEGALFLDSGSVVPSISQLDLDSFQSAAGAGLRLRTPVGPIRVDFGYKLDDPGPLDQWRIHFSFGYPF